MIEYSVVAPAPPSDVRKKSDLFWVELLVIHWWCVLLPM